MDDKKKLKRLLLRMYILAKKGEFKEAQKLNLNYRPLQRKVFGPGGLSKAEEPFDMAANNILMATGNFGEKIRREYLDKALKYINKIKV